MSKKPDIDWIRQLEELETNLSNLAPIMTTYYKSLFEQGIPDELAYRLVVGFQQILLDGANRSSTK